MTSSLKFRGASSSSSSAHQWTYYDVFLSFRGEDTRKNFTGQLYDALERNGLKTFIDDEQLRSGEEIPSALVKTIEESRILIVVLSENYASSACCLNELTKIVECMEKKNQVVLPVFYGVEPSDVRHQRNNIKKSLGKLEERYRVENVERWKAALRQVGNISGWHLHGDRSNEAQVIDEIVGNIASHLRSIARHTIIFEAAKHPVKHPDGIESHVQEPHLSSLPSENGEQQSNYSISSQGVSLFLIASVIASVIGLHQMDALFETHLANKWTYEAALIIFCLSSAAMTKINGTRWARYSKSRIIDSFRVLSVTLLAVSPSSVLPHQLSRLFYVIFLKQLAEHLVKHLNGIIECSAQVPNLSSSPRRVGIQYHEQVSHLSSSQSPLEIDSHVPEPHLPSLPSGNRDPGNNPSVSNEQQSNSSLLSQGVILFLIASVIGLQQLDNQFRTHPANMWIAQVALLLFCLSYATIPKINGTHWEEYSQIIDGFRIISGTLFTASLSSIHLPHQLWFLFYAMWVALMCVVVVYKILKKEIIVACRGIYSKVMERGFENNGRELPVRATNHSYITPTPTRSQNPGHSTVSQIIEKLFKDGRDQHMAQLAAQKEHVDVLLAAQREQMATLLAAQREHIAALINAAQINAAQMAVQLAAQMAAKEVQMAAQMAAKGAQMVANDAACVAHFRQLDSMMEVSSVPEVTQLKAPPNTESFGRVRVRSSVGSRSDDVRVKAEEADHIESQQKNQSEQKFHLSTHCSCGSA